MKQSLLNIVKQESLFMNDINLEVIKTSLQPKVCDVKKIQNFL